MSPRRYTCIEPPVLQHSIPPCLHVATPAARLQSSRAPYLHVLRVPVPSRAPELYTSVPPRRHAFSAPSSLHTSTSARLQRASRALGFMPPNIHAPTSLPTSRLHSS